MTVFPRKTSLVRAVFIKGKAIIEDMETNTQHPTSLRKNLMIVLWLQATGNLEQPSLSQVREKSL